MHTDSHVVLPPFHSRAELGSPRECSCRSAQSACPSSDGPCAQAAAKMLSSHRALDLLGTWLLQPGTPGTRRRPAFHAVMAVMGAKLSPASSSMNSLSERRSPSMRLVERLDQSGCQAIARFGRDPLLLGPLEEREDPAAEVLRGEFRHPRHDMDMQMFEARLLAEQHDVRLHTARDG